MRLTKSEFINCINTLEKMFNEENDISIALNIGCEWRGEMWINEYYEFFKCMCELPENDIYGTDVDYFMFDLDFGHGWTENCITDENGKSIKLTTPEELWDFIMESENGYEKDSE